MENQLCYTVLCEENINAFRPYLTDEAALPDPDVLALGAIVGEYACGAVAARVYGDGQARLLAMSVDPAVRRRGVGSMLLRNLLMRLRTAHTITADYRGSEAEVAAADAFFSSVWGGTPGNIGTVFRLKAFELRDTPLFGRFGIAAPGRSAVRRFDMLPPESLERLLKETEIPENLRWNTLPGRLHPELSFAWETGGRAEAYIAVTEERKGVLEPVLVALGNKSFVLLPLLSASARAVLERCPPETELEIVCVDSVSEGLGLRLLGRKYLVAREHRSVCILKAEGRERFG